MTDLHITPQGFLRDQEGTFLAGNGAGLLKLIATSLSDQTPAKLFFQKLCKKHILELSAFGDPEDNDLSDFFAQTRPGMEELRFALLSAPPIHGGEYLNAELLLQFHSDFEAAVQQELLASELSFTDFVRGLSPAWKDVGKVSFHLAENKGDSTGVRPFAFMASFIHRSVDDRARHLPLATALKAYANDPRALTAVLAPVEQAATHSELIRDLLESRRIFQPIAWSSQEAYMFLRDMEHFTAANIVVRVVNLWKKQPPRPQVSVSLDVNRKSKMGANSMLQFSVAVTLNGETLTDEEIKLLLQNNGGLVRIKGDWVQAEPDKIAALLQEWKEAEALTHTNGVTLTEGLRLLAGAKWGGKQAQNAEENEYRQINATGELKKLLEELADPQNVQLPRLPSKLQQILRPYQLEGVKFLWCAARLHLGVCLADDMGLGKTLQVLTMLQLWKQAGHLDKSPALLVVPATLLDNWLQESAKFTPDLRLSLLHPSAMSNSQNEAFAADTAAYLAEFDVVLTTYGMLHRMPELQRVQFPVAIADEAQAIKNPTAKQSRALRSLDAAWRLVMTGTPVENRLTDLWSLFDFIHPGLLGGLKPFLTFSKQLNEDYSPLRRLTQPFILRRLKTDKRIISDLPDKTELKVYCSLSRSQAALYAKTVENLHEALFDESVSSGIQRRGLVLSYLMRFKQICNHPAQYLGNGDFSPTLSGKFQHLSELVESISSRQERLLVFTQFREMTSPLHDFLASCFGRSGLVLHGGTPVGARPNLVRSFQDCDGPPFFVLSLKAAGTGLNLTAANHVIHFDRWWNPAVENQASDRAFRIGQKRNVLVHKFICKGTLEEKIDSLITDKQQLADDVLHGGGEKLLTEMSNDELLNLVQLEPFNLENPR